MMTCSGCGCDNRDSKLLTWKFVNMQTSQTRMYTHCDACYFAILPEADEQTFDELEWEY